MDTSDWPHEKIRSVALRYIREHAAKEAEWRFTRLDALPERLARIVHLDEPERAIVSCPQPLSLAGGRLPEFYFVSFRIDDPSKLSILGLVNLLKYIESAQEKIGRAHV